MHRLKHLLEQVTKVVVTKYLFSVTFPMFELPHVAARNTVPLLEVFNIVETSPTQISPLECDWYLEECDFKNTLDRVIFIINPFLCKSSNCDLGHHVSATTVCKGVDMMSKLAN